MITNKGLVKGKAIVYLFMVLPIFILGVLSSYYVLRSSKLNSQFKQSKEEYAKLSQEKTALKDSLTKLQNDFNRLQNDFNGQNQDRQNLINQIKELQADRGHAKELEGTLEDVKKERGRMEKEKGEIIEQNMALRESLKNIEVIQKRLIREKEELTQTLERERAKSFVKNLEQDRANLKKENGELLTKIVQWQSEYAKLKDSSMKTEQQLDKKTQEAEELRKKEDRLNDDYAQALKKNRLFEQQVANMPTKFAELSRQNRVLIKQTSNMHYNLGVFYTTQKEYTRAITEFEKALELTPDDAYSHFNLGYIYAEYIVDRAKAIEHFRQYLRLAKNNDKDIDWVKKYIITWETWQGKKPIE